MKFRKIFGWFLLPAGVIIIFWSLYSSYNIFTAKVEVPEIFKIAESTLSQKETQDLETQMQEMIGEQLKGIIPAGSMVTFFNLIAWSIFAGILIFGGAQISNLGIKLIKK